MLHHGYWLFEYVSISRTIVRGPVQYGEAFLHTETDDNDLTYFLVYHLDIINRSIAELHRFIEDRGRELRALDAHLRGIAELNHRQRELIRHALRHPGFSYTIESHRASHDVVYQTARTDLLDLERRGLLSKRKVGHGFVFIPVEGLEEKLREPPRGRGIEPSRGVLSTIRYRTRGQTFNYRREGSLPLPFSSVS